MNSGTTEPAIEPWLVSDTEYPTAGTIGEKLRFLLRYAILAPSGHNTQTWPLTIAGGESNCMRIGRVPFPLSTPMIGS